MRDARYWDNLKAWLCVLLGMLALAWGFVPILMISLATDRGELHNAVAQKIVGGACWWLVLRMGGSSKGGEHG